MPTNKAQCKGCRFWGSADGTKSTVHLCHHLLWTGKRREQKDGVCLSRKEAGRK